MRSDEAQAKVGQGRSCLRGWREANVDCAPEPRPGELRERVSATSEGKSKICRAYPGPSGGRTRANNGVGANQTKGERSEPGGEQNLFCDPEPRPGEAEDGAANERPARGGRGGLEGPKGEVLRKPPPGPSIKNVSPSQGGIKGEVLRKPPPGPSMKRFPSQGGIKGEIL